MYSQFMMHGQKNIKLLVHLWSCTSTCPFVFIVSCLKELCSLCRSPVQVTIQLSTAVTTFTFLYTRMSTEKNLPWAVKF